MKNKPFILFQIALYDQNKSAFLSVIIQRGYFKPQISPEKNMPSVVFE